MTTMTVPRTPIPPAAKATVEPTAREIISQARTAPAPAKGALMVSGATALLTWAAFTPLDWGPLGWGLSSTRITIGSLAASHTLDVPGFVRGEFRG
jgi:hypothetical protein